MGSRTITADTWRAHTTDTIDRLTAGLLDLIDIGTPDVHTHPRPPTRNELLATERTDGHYQPTPAGTSRTPGISRPVETAVIGWERQVQQATTDLTDLIGDWKSTTNIPPPDLPPRRLNLQGRWTVDVDPSPCRRLVVETHAWLLDLVGHIAGRLQTDVGDEWVRWKGTAAVLQSDLTRLRHRWAPDRPRLCACGCRRPAPPRGQGATRPACRTRLHRQRRSA